jgi:acetyl esterase/lipase
MSAEEREAARGMMQKAELGRTAEKQRAEFDELFASRPLGDDVKLVERTLGGVPALEVHVGTAEILLDDSLRLVARAAEQDVDVSLDVVAGAPHVFQYFAGFMSEADESLDHAATFIKNRLRDKSVGAVA